MAVPSGAEFPVVYSQATQVPAAFRSSRKVREKLGAELLWGRENQKWPPTFLKSRSS